MQNNLVNGDAPAAPIPDVLATPEKMELKPERVQEAIARQLGWFNRKGVNGIHRTREFADHIEAEHFVEFAARIAGRRRQPLIVHQAGRKVTLTLKGKPGRSRVSGMTDAVYDLAVALG